jgi:hypothetical protein
VRRRAVQPAQSSLDDPTFRQHDEAFDFAFIVFDDGYLDPACFVGGTLGFIARISTVDKSELYPRAFQAHGFQQRRQGWAILASAVVTW